MSRYRFELAGPDDDADLRHVLANTPMPGRIALTFRRAPSFFAAPGVNGFLRQIVACRDTASGRIVGFGCRALRRMYVNGEPRTIGYLSSMRLLAEHRNQGLVARGYRFFRELHGDGQTPLYLTTIAESNEPALRILTSGRAGLPTYHPAGAYRMAALLIREQRVPTLADVEIRPACASDLAALNRFVQEWGPRRQFFPCYSEVDWRDGGALQGLNTADVLLARRSGMIVGMLAAWDQSAFRQTVVQSYQGLVGWLRPIYNGWARLRRGARLPPVGEPLCYVTGTLPLVANDDAAVFDALLRTLLQHSASGPWRYLIVGLAEGDPLLDVLRRYDATWYTTRIYQVCMEDGVSFRNGLDVRPIYLELGAL
jgi:hypothetical protein